MATVNRHGHAAGQQIAKRLDALGKLQSGCVGVSWWFVRVFFVAGGAWAMTTIHLVAFAYLLSTVHEDFPMAPEQRALVGGIISLGAFVGAFFFGNLADVHGRKFALMIAFTLAHTASALCTVSPNLEVFAAFRFIAGIGLGGEQPILIAFITEFAPANIRGRALVYLESFSVVGIIITVLLCRELEPLIGWRMLYACDIAALLYLPLIYYVIPESPKWLATAGYYKEAVTVLRSIEKASSVFHGEDADNAIYSLQLCDDTRHTIQAHEIPLRKAVLDRARILLQYPYLARTVMLWVVWSGMSMSNAATLIYLGGDFLRSVLNRGEESLVVYASMVAQLFGNLTAAALIDRIGRRYSIICGLVVASAASLLQVYLDPGLLTILLSSCLRNFAFTGAWGCLYAYTPELYPISVRVVGISYAWGISRIGAFTGPFTVVLAIQQFQLSTAVIMWIFCGLSFCVAIVLLALGIETAPYAAEKRRSTGMDSRSGGEALVLAYVKHEEGEKV